MLYRVKLQYNVFVEAASSRDAFRQVCRALRDNPGSHIAGVENVDAPKGNPSLLKRLITGQ